MRVWIAELQDEKGRPFEPVGPWYFNRASAMSEVERRQKQYPEFRYRIRGYERSGSTVSEKP